VAVSATGKFVKMALDKITDFSGLDWKVIPGKSDPTEVEI
jgi:hypothetical protein